MAENLPFFGKTESQTSLLSADSRISGLTSGTEFERARNNHISQILRSMYRAHTEWDEKCLVNIQTIGNHFMREVANIINLDKAKLDELFALCFRFLSEVFLSTKDDLTMELEAARRFALEDKDHFDGLARAHIDWAIYQMPTFILKSLISNDSVKSLQNLSNTYHTAEKKREEWNSELVIHQGKVEALKESLDKYKTAFNFVGLYDGFDDLATTKKTEKANLLWGLKVFGVLILLPFLSEIIFIQRNFADLESLKTALLISIIPTLSITAILIYYFRVLLHNFNAVKAQILQIELRKTLCRFIQSYADYAKEMKEKNSESLSKFESIIFSSIVSSEEKLPSTFDGIEQLSNLFKSIKS